MRAYFLSIACSPTLNPVPKYYVIISRCSVGSAVMFKRLFGLLRTSRDTHRVNFASLCGSNHILHCLDDFQNIIKWWCPLRFISFVREKSLQTSLLYPSQVFCRNSQAEAWVSCYLGSGAPVYAWFCDWT